MPKSSTLTKNGFKNHGFVGDIERHPSFSFNSHSQMTYKSDDIIETENENVDQSNIDVLEVQREIPISPKSTRKAKAPIPLSFKSENQPQIEPSDAGSLARKSRTPSPNSNKTLDDIVLVSEVIDTLTEMREPNGKTYFVDENRNLAPPVVDVHEDSEQKTAIAYLDAVLKKEDVNDDNLKGKMNDVGFSTSVVALVHLNGATDEEQPIDESIAKDKQQNSPDEEKILFENPEVEVANVSVMCNIEDESVQEKLNDPDTSSQFKLTLENDIDDTELPVDRSTEINNTNKMLKKFDDELANNSPLTDDRKSVKEVDIDDSNLEKTVTFKERLAMLLGQQPVAEVRRISPRSNEHIPENTKPEPTLKHSKSEPDIMQLVFKDIRSKYEHNEPDGLKQSSQLKLTATDDINIENSNINVPAPPKFDPFIYKTIGSRHNARTPLKIGIASNENDSSAKPPTTAPIIMDNEVVLRKKSLEEDDQTRMISIKDRLENILKRGPPDRFSRPKSVVPAAALVDDATDIETGTVKSSNVDREKTGDNDDQEMIHFKESKKPFDTVHKQKVLFNDVLKSMGVETRPSIIRANSITKLKEKPTTIEGARNALKHISPDWKKNVDVD